MEKKYWKILAIIFMALFVFLIFILFGLKLQEDNVNNYNSVNDYTVNFTNVDSCSTLPLNEQGDCYFSFAYIDNDVTICDKSQNEGDKIYCYTSYALETEELGICDLLDDDKAVCYALYATIYSDSSVCSKLSDQNEVDFCYESFYEEL